MKGECLKIEHVKRRVFRTSFLKNVSYIFLLSETSRSEEKVKNYADSLRSDGYEIKEFSDFAKGFVVALKSGISIIANRELFIVNAHVSKYESYDHFKTIVLSYLQQYCDVIDASKVAAMHIFKVNEFKLDRSKPDMETVTPEQFEQVVCSSEFLKNADDRQIEPGPDENGIQRYAKCNINEGEKNYTLELTVAASDYNLRDLRNVESRLDMLNDAAYDVWNAILSDTMKQSLRENENK